MRPISDEWVVAVVPIRRVEVERRLPDVFTALSLNQAVEGIVGVFACWFDLCVVVEDSLERGIFHRGDVARRIVGVAQILHHGRVLEQLRGGGIWVGRASGL